MYVPLPVLQSHPPLDLNLSREIKLHYPFAFGSQLPLTADLKILHRSQGGLVPTDVRSGRSCFAGKDQDV